MYMQNLKHGQMLFFFAYSDDLETDEGWGGGEHPLKQKLLPLSVVVLCII